MKRGFALVAVMLLVAAILPACFVRKAGAEGQVVLNPTDDTYIDDYNPQSNFGAQDAVKLSSYQPSFLWYHTDIWLKFDLSSIPADATVDSATLELYAVNVTDPYNHTWAYSCTNSSWSESTLTFQDYQDHLLGDMNFTLMSDIPVPLPSQWYNWSVNGAVVNALSQGREKVTLVLMVGNGEIHESSSYAEFSSKESLLGMAFAPRLIVHWSSALPGFEGIRLEPKTATNHVGTSHTLRAFVTGKDGVPVPMVHVNFTIVSGPNAGRSMEATADPNGVAAFSWSSEISGTDVVNATITGETVSDTASKTWESGIGDIRLEPKTSTNRVGTSHTLRAFVTSTGEPASPVPFVHVNFTITSGPNVGRTLLATADANGVAAFSWSSEISGTDVVNATITGEIVFDTASKTWESGIGGIRLEPKTSTNHVGTSHTLRAFVTSTGQTPVPVPYVHVNFTAASGPNAGRTWLATTDANGVAEFSWTSEVSGTDIVNATIAGETVFDTASKTWQSGFFDPFMDTINRIPIGVIVGTALLTIALVGSYAVLRWKRKTH